MILMKYTPGTDLTKYLDQYRYFPRLTKLLFSDIGETIRNRGYLTYEDLALIYVWKAILWQTHGTFTSHGLESEESAIRHATERIFQINHTNQQEVATLLSDLTDSLRGVGMKVATAIVSVMFPDRYGVIDLHVQEALDIRGEDPDSYAKMLFRLREIANEQESVALRKHWTPRMVDMALYELGKSRT